MQILLWILVGIIVLMIAAVLLISYKFAHMVLRPNTHDTEFLLNEAYEFNRFTPEYIESLEKEEIIIPSRYGYDMHGVILDDELTRKPENRTKVAILCHGYTSGKLVMSGYAGILMKLGFTCVMYDHRNHGDNDKSVNTTMGYYEKYDLETVMDWVYERYGNDIRVITYGESMGSAIVLSHLEIDDRPVMTIADCGYSDLVGLFRYLLKEVYHMPVFPILPISGVMLKIGGHFDMKDVSPIRGVKKAKIPILFCHGKSDTFIPCRMSVEMSKTGEGVRELYLCDNAEHAQSYSIDHEKYSKIVTDFINKYY